MSFVVENFQAEKREEISHIGARNFPLNSSMRFAIDRDKGVLLVIHTPGGGPDGDYPAHISLSIGRNLLRIRASRCVVGDKTGWGRSVLWMNFDVHSVEELRNKESEIMTTIVEGLRVLEKDALGNKLIELSFDVQNANFAYFQGKYCGHRS